MRVEVLRPIESTGELKDVAAKARNAVRAAIVPGLMCRSPGQDPAANPVAPPSPDAAGEPRTAPTAGP